MLSELRRAIIALATLTLLTGVLYPGLVTVIAKGLFPHQAGGSLVVKGDKTVGSLLLAQPFDEPKYFWGRLSATSPAPNNASASAGSNLGPTNPALTDAATARAKALRQADPENAAKIPVDLVTASGSGLDPHVSPAAAHYQVLRVARARGLDEGQVRKLVEAHTQGPDLGLFGQARVNVLLLNRALDGLD